MGYYVTIKADRPITKDELAEFVRSVPSDKRCPTGLQPIINPDLSITAAQITDRIFINGVYSMSGTLAHPYVNDFMIPWFKARDVQLTVDWSGF